jgi:pimeloyl-ACP methyl ester carboxylesterase
VAIERVEYDEFGLFADNASEFGLPYEGPPTVRREFVAVDRDRRLSALVWGTEPPELVFLHGGAQNAHTWDTVALALGRPLVAIDLPGHGHSDGGKEGQLDLADNAADVAVAIGELAPDAKAVIGMSLGGLTSLELAHRHPDLVRKLVLVDITPGVNQDKAKAVIDFVNGPQSFENFDDLLKRTIEHNPTRSVSSLRRGILHNAHQTPEGHWEWNYDRRGHARSRDELPSGQEVAHSPLWDHFSELKIPIALLRGSISPVVDDADVAEALRRQPDLRVDVVDGAGHSIQGDRPIELATLIREIAL